MHGENNCTITTACCGTTAAFIILSRVLHISDLHYFQSKIATAEVAVVVNSISFSSTRSLVLVIEFKVRISQFFPAEVIIIEIKNVNVLRI